MKIAGISDLHGDLINDFEECDIVCICGDTLPLSIQRNNQKSRKWLKEEFKPWAESLPCDKVFFIGGNHCFCMESTPQFMLDNFKKDDKVTYLCNEEFIYNCDGKDYKIYGTPYCPDLYRWAFYKDHDNLIKEFSKIPENVDILLTHCPPKIDHYGVVLQQGVYNHFTDYGCEELADSVKIKHPKLHIFGHVHSGDHEAKLIGKTLYCNVSIKNENYNITYYPIYFEQ